MTFTLIEDPDNVTAADLATRWGITRQTVHNYIRRGLPVRRKAPGGMVFLSWRACEEWRAANMPDFVPGSSDSPGRAAGLTTNGRGGRRPGSGRKPIDHGAGTGQLHSTQHTAHSGTPEPSGPATGQDEAQKLLAEIHGPDDMLRLLRDGRMTRSLAQTVLETWKSIELQTKLQRDRGRLIDAGEAEQAWTRALQQLRGELDNLPGTAAQRLLAAGAIKPDQEAAARAVLEAEVDRVLGMLAGGVKTGSNAEAAENAEKNAEVKP